MVDCLVIVLLALAIFSLICLIKNQSPLLEECYFCHGLFFRDRMHIIQEGQHSITVCPYCLEKAEKQGFDIHEEKEENKQ